MEMEGPKPLQRGIDSCPRQSCEGSESPQAKRTRVDKNDDSGEHNGVGASHGQKCGGKRKRGEEMHVSRYKGTVVKDGDQYAKMALEFYEKSVNKDAKFKLREVLFSNCACLVVPGYKGVREWCHLRFTAEPVNADDSPKQFFGELVLGLDSGIDRVTHCSIFDPTEPGLTYGCEFCPTSPLCLHPPDGFLTGDLSCTTYSKFCSAFDSCKREHSEVAASHEQMGGDSESQQVKLKSDKHVSRQKAGIDSSYGQMDEGSDSVRKRKRVKKNHVSGEHSGVDASHGQMGGGSASNQDMDNLDENMVQRRIGSSSEQMGKTPKFHRAKHKRVETDHVSRNKSHVAKNSIKYAKMALKYYEKSNRQDGKFKLREVLFSVRANLRVPGYKGARDWCHLSFTAQPINEEDDDSPKQRFFGELVLGRDSGAHRVTHCSIFHPNEPGLTHGCEFCPSASLCVHPADGYLTGDLSCVVHSKSESANRIQFKYSNVSWL